VKSETDRGLGGKRKCFGIGEICEKGGDDVGGEGVTSAYSPKETKGREGEL